MYWVVCCTFLYISLSWWHVWLNSTSLDAHRWSEILSALVQGHNLNICRWTFGQTFHSHLQWLEFLWLIASCLHILIFQKSTGLYSCFLANIIPMSIGQWCLVHLCVRDKISVFSHWLSRSRPWDRVLSTKEIHWSEMAFSCTEWKPFETFSKVIIVWSKTLQVKERIEGVSSLKRQGISRLPRTTIGNFSRESRLVHT